jgi:hypothetical protein
MQRPEDQQTTGTLEWYSLSPVTTTSIIRLNPEVPSDTTVVPHFPEEHYCLELLSLTPAGRYVLTALGRKQVPVLDYPVIDSLYPYKLAVQRVLEEVSEDAGRLFIPA